MKFSVDNSFNEQENSISPHKSHHSTNSSKVSWLSFLNDCLKSPQQIVGVFVTVIILVYGAIKVKKAGVILSSKTTVLSDDDEQAAASSYVKTRRISELVRNVGHTVARSVVISSLVNFWKKVPTRLRNFYITAFLVPRYRKEWGKYRTWSFRDPVRPHKSHFLKEELRRIRQENQKSITPLKSMAALSSKKVEEVPLPKPTPHIHSCCRRVRINVGGRVYETQLRTLNRYPHSLLGDPNRRIRYYNPITQEYFFDRNRNTFEAILYFYQSGGRFKRPDNISADILLDDAKFYGLPQSVIYQYLCDEGLSSMSEEDEIFPENHFQRKIWLLFDYPQSTLQAQLVSLISVLAITLSIVTFCIETLDSLSPTAQFILDTPDRKVYVTRPGHILEIRDPFVFTETVCFIWFIVEYLVRFVSSPIKSDFFLQALNIVDLISIIPYFVQLVLNDLNSRDPMTQVKPKGSVTIIRVVRLVRVFRIFKLSRHSKGLKILGRTLQASLNELMLLIFFVAIGVILFASTMYFAEAGAEGTHFVSIPDGFWWALITITTVGYGDNVPKTDEGKIVGALCAVAGVLTLALPVPVIVSNFNFFYHQSLGESDLSGISISHTTPCPFRAMESHGDIEYYSEDVKKKRKNGNTGTKNNTTTPKQTHHHHHPVEYSSDEEFGMLKVNPS